MNAAISSTLPPGSIMTVFRDFLLFRLLLPEAPFFSECAGSCPVPAVRRSGSRKTHTQGHQGLLSPQGQVRCEPELVTGVHRIGFDPVFRGPEAFRCNDGYRL